MSTPAFTMLTTLADDPRNKLPEWYLEIRTKARNLCSAHDAAGALSLIAQDVDWQQFPGVLTNPVDVAAGNPAVYRARPTFDYPADHAGNAAAAVLSVYRQEVGRHEAFTNASSLLATALLESIGDTNRTQLEASFHPLPLYAITPAQIVTTMITLYGVATGTDLQRLREPLSEPLKTLADLEPFMAKFKLNTLKLTASGYWKVPLRLLRGLPHYTTGLPYSGYQYVYVLRPVPASRRPHHRQPVPVPDNTDHVPTGPVQRLPILWCGDPKAPQQKQIKQKYHSQRGQDSRKTAMGTQRTNDNGQPICRRLGSSCCDPPPRL